MPILTFDEATHQYTAEGTKVPSVSQILRAAGLIDLTWVDEEALKRGSMVHQTIEWALQGVLDEAALHPKLAGYLAAFRKAQAEVAFKVCMNESNEPLVEVRVFHPIYRYAGTLDLLVERGGQRIVVDLKSGSPSAWHPIQTAGYALTFTTELLGRANLYVADDGSYKWIEHKDRKDFEVFKAALTIAHFRRDNGLTEERR